MTEQIPNINEQNDVKELVTLATGLQEMAGDLASKISNIAQKERAGQLSDDEKTLAISMFSSLREIQGEIEEVENMLGQFSGERQ